jgi:hypothetical protein
MIRVQVSPVTAPGVFDPATTPPASQLALARHAFDVDAAGLHHYTDGVHRATVPPEGWDDYAEHYEGAREAIAAHRAAVALSQSETGAAS